MSKCIYILYTYINTYVCTYYSGNSVSCGVRRVLFLLYIYIPVSRVRLFVVTGRLAPGHPVSACALSFDRALRIGIFSTIQAPFHRITSFDSFTWTRVFAHSSGYIPSRK